MTSKTTAIYLVDMLWKEGLTTLHIQLLFPYWNGLQLCSLAIHHWVDERCSLPLPPFPYDIPLTAPTPPSSFYYILIGFLRMILLSHFGAGWLCSRGDYSGVSVVGLNDATGPLFYLAVKYDTSLMTTDGKKFTICFHVQQFIFSDICNISQLRPPSQKEEEEIWNYTLP